MLFKQMCSLGAKITHIFVIRLAKHFRVLAN